MTLRPRIIQRINDPDSSRYEFHGWEDTGLYELVEDALPTKEYLKSYAESKRLQAEVSGININGIHISTDDRAKIMISGARQAADNNPEFVIPWALSSGDTVVLDAPSIISISEAVLGHVAWVFELYSGIVVQIDEGSITSVAQVDEIL